MYKINYLFLGMKQLRHQCKTKLIFLKDAITMQQSIDIPYLSVESLW